MNAITKITTPRPGLDQAAEAARAAALVSERAGGGEPGGEQQVGDRQQDVDGARDERVGPAAEVAGEQAGDDAERRSRGSSRRRRRPARRGRRRRSGVKTSRPSWSTPKMCSALGPVGVAKSGSSAAVSRSSGPGAPKMLTTTGAKIATRISRTMKTSDASASLSSRKRRQKSCHGVRAGISTASMSGELGAAADRRGALLAKLPCGQAVARAVSSRHGRQPTNSSPAASPPESQPGQASRAPGAREPSR